MSRCHFVCQLENFPTTVSPELWDVIEPLFSGHKSKTRPIQADLRRILSGIFYLLKTGCQWALLPREFGAKSTCYYWFKKWITADENGHCTLHEAHRVLAAHLRKTARKQEHPSTLIVDGQCVQNTFSAPKGGFHGGKKIKGILRTVAVDSLGLLHAWHVGQANQDERGAALQALAIAPDLSRLETVLADAGYTGENFADKVFLTCPGDVEVRILKRNSTAFRLQPIRWVVETFFAWLGHCRRLDKNHEKSAKTSCSWMVFASLFRMVKAIGKDIG